MINKIYSIFEERTNFSRDALPSIQIDQFADSETFDRVGVTHFDELTSGFHTPARRYQIVDNKYVGLTMNTTFLYFEGIRSVFEFVFDLKRRSWKFSLFSDRNERDFQG